MQKSRATALKALTVLLLCALSVPLVVLGHGNSSVAPAGTSPIAPGNGTAGAGVSPGPGIGPRSAPLTTVVWKGNQVISTAVTLSNETVIESGGNVTVASGGSLTLQNATLTITEDIGSTLAALVHGLIVNSGGTLTATYSTIEGGNGTSWPAYVDLAGTARLTHSSLYALGGTGSSPVSGAQGVLVGSSHATFDHDWFNYVYEVKLSGTGARGDLISNSTFTNSTITGGGAGWVDLSGGASWLNLTHDIFAGSADAGVLLAIRGPHVTVSDSTFIGDASGTQQNEIYIGYDGSTDSGVNGSYLNFSGNRLQTANIQVHNGMYLSFVGNTINDTGHWSSTAGQAAILLATWIGSGAGHFIRHVKIIGNTITNFGHYGIRVSQNETDVNISGNRILYTHSVYTTSITEADGIYIIRAIHNGTVWNNTVDMTDSTQPSEPANGIILESQVNDFNVSRNHIYNCSEAALTVQGDDGADGEPLYYRGGSQRNILFENTIINFHSVAQETMYSTEAIETWGWANHTQIVGNYIRGWTQVNTNITYNGAAVFTSGSEQRIGGNTIVDARYAFVFRRFDPKFENALNGSFNRSFNVLDNNSVSKISVTTLVEVSTDGMGKVVNILTGRLDPTWTVSLVGSNASMRVVGGDADWLNSTSPYLKSGFVYYPTLSLDRLSTGYTVSLNLWNGSAAALGFAGLRQGVPKAAGWYNVTYSSSVPATGAVNWTAQLASQATVSLTLATPTSLQYRFYVDGSLSTTVTASGTTASLSWTGSGRHTFAWVPVSNQSGGGGSSSPLSAQVSANRTSGTAPLAVQFSSTVSGGVSPYSYSWSFGDGNTSTAASPSHTYARAGNFTATLTVTDSNASSVSQSLLLQVAAPPSTNNSSLPLTLQLSANRTSATAPAAIQFTSAVSGGLSPYAYAWAFGDGNTSTAASPSHTYAQAGNFSVSLTVTDANLSTATGSLTVRISTAPSTNNSSQPLAVQVSANRTNATSPASIQFVSSVSGGLAPYAYSWTFGDGNGSAAANPSHTYVQTGNFSVSLTVTDAGSSSVTQSLAIQVAPAPSSNNSSVPLSLQISASPTSGTAPLSVQFSSGVSGGTAPYSYSWTFGDGNTSSLAGPAHVYGSTGNFTVTCTATDALHASITRSLLVSVSAAAQNNSSAGLPGSGWGTINSIIHLPPLILPVGTAVFAVPTAGAAGILRMARKARQRLARRGRPSVGSPVPSSTRTVDVPDFPEPYGPLDLE